ncbi:MAG: FlgD immunoglobulin-like domain containing protein [bacterium]|nr:FlgD immunoglobulin-like domain containing protein [bacterium]
MRLKLLCALLLGLPCLPRPAACECLDYADRLHWAGRALVGGAIEDVAVDAQHAYVAVTDVGLKVLDLADPSFPSYRATLARTGGGWRIVVDWPRVYLLSTSGLPRLDVIDVTVPTAPVLAGSCALDAGALDLAVAGHRAYVVRAAAGAGELMVVDATNPASMTVAARRPLPAGVLTVAVGAGRLVAAGGTPAATVLDLADPDAPLQTGSWADALSPSAVDLAGELAFVAGPGGMAVLDLAAGGDPVARGRLADPGGWTGVACDGAGGVWLTRRDDDPAGGEARRVDVTFPEAPSSVGSLSTGAQAVVAAGDRAWLARGAAGLDALVAGAGPATTIGAWPSPALDAAPVAIAARGAVAVVVHDATVDDNPRGLLHALDLSDPAQPRDRGGLEFAGAPTDVAVEEGLAAFAWYHARTNRGRVVLADLSGDGSPSLMGSVTVYGEPTRLVLSPPWLYCGVRGTGAGIGHHLLVIDVADPAAPRLALVWTMSYAATAMALQGDRLRLAGLDGVLPYLQTLDVTQPDDPTSLSFYPMSRAYSDLRVRGDLLYGLEAGGTLDLIDISEDFLWFRDVLDLPSPPAALAVRGEQVLIAGGDLTAVDATDPDAMRARGSARLAGAVDVAALETCLLALDAAGVTVLPLPCNAIVPIEPPAEPPAADGPTPAALRLLGVAPNPFNPATTVRFALPRPASVAVEVFALDGRRVRTLLRAPRPAGEHLAEWDGRDDDDRMQPSGAYVVRIEADGRSDARKVQLVR